MKTKLCFFSDTHREHDKVELPECDIAIFCGDFSYRGHLEELKNFMDWYTKQFQCTYRVMIAGNHDTCMDPTFSNYEKAMEMMEEYKRNDPNLVYLSNSSETLFGHKIYGSAVTPTFGFNWGFNRDPGSQIRKEWDKIDKDTNILVTHGPVYGHLDLTKSGVNAGCRDLHYKLEELDHLLIHSCGHIHEAYGTKMVRGTTLINASILDIKYKPVNKPISIYI